jgi:hypothetical protein
MRRTGKTRRQKKRRRRRSLWLCCFELLVELDARLVALVVAPLGRPPPRPLLAVGASRRGSWKRIENADCWEGS